MVDSLLSTPTMVSAVNYRARPSPCSLAHSTVNQRLHRLTPIQMPTMLPLRRRRLPPALPKVAILLAVGPGLAVLLGAPVIVALHSEVVRGAPRLLGAHLMHPLFVFWIDD
jgi:hypothetical protein